MGGGGRLHRVVFVAPSAASAVLLVLVFIGQLVCIQQRERETSGEVERGDALVQFAGIDRVPHELPSGTLRRRKMRPIDDSVKIEDVFVNQLGE